MGISVTDFQSIVARLEHNRAKADHCDHASSDAVPAGQESRLHEFIAEECRRRHWICLHGSMAHRAMRTVGEPDFTILADRSRVFHVECKTRAGKLTVPQMALKIMAESLGHTIHVVRSQREFLEVVK